MTRSCARQCASSSSVTGTVHEAENGVAGINPIDTVRPDLVFLDVSMPVMTGPQFVEELARRRDSHSFGDHNDVGSSQRAPSRDEVVLTQAGPPFAAFRGGPRFLRKGNDDGGSGDARSGERLSRIEVTEEPLERSAQRAAAARTHSAVTQMRRDRRRCENGRCAAWSIRQALGCEVRSPRMPCLRARVAGRRGRTASLDVNTAGGASERVAASSSVDPTAACDSLVVANAKPPTSLPSA